MADCQALLSDLIGGILNAPQERVQSDIRQSIWFLIIAHQNSTMVPERPSNSGSLMKGDLRIALRIRDLSSVIFLNSS